MLKSENLINQRFGKLVVIERAESYRYISKTGRLTCRGKSLCKCDCGNTRIVPNNKLKAGKIITCLPCAYASRPQSTRRLTKEERLFKLHITNHAPSRGIKVDLNLEQFKNIIKNNCFYCDEPPKLIDVYKNKFSKSEKILFNGIDRINSDLDYSINNVVACCSTCNFMKSDMSVKDFYTHINKIIKHKGKR